MDIESTPSSVAVRENQSINMTCRADGFPAPKIIWRREDGQSITVERKKKGKKGKFYFEIDLKYIKKIANKFHTYLYSFITDN